MNTGDWYYDYSIPTIPFIIGSLFLVIAGRTFGAIETTLTPTSTSQSPMPSDRGRVTVVLTSHQELDIVLYVANLVSNPVDIAPLLTDLQKVTTHIEKGHELSLDDRKILKYVYEHLEGYLLHNDTLRVFTQQELRERIVNRFGFNGPIWTSLWDKNSTQTSGS